MTGTPIPDVGSQARSDGCHNAHPYLLDTREGDVECGLWLRHSADSSTYGHLSANRPTYGHLSANPSTYGHLSADPPTFGQLSANPSTYDYTSADPSTYDYTFADLHTPTDGHRGSNLDPVGNP